MKFKNISNIVRLLVSVLLVIFIYRFFDIKLDDLIRSAADSKKGALGSAFLLMPVTMLLQMFKWYQLLKLADDTVRFSDAVSSHLAGMTLGFITPARLGELGRAWFLEDLSQIKVVGLTLAEKFYSTLAYFILGISSLIVFFNLNFSLSLSSNVAIILSSLLIYFLIGIAILRPEKVGKLVILSGKLLPWKEQIQNISSIISSLKREKIFIVLGLAALVWFSVLAQLWLLINAFSDVELFTGLLSASSAQFAKTLLPFTFGEMGVREAAMIFFFSYADVSELAAVSAALSIVLMNVILPASTGLIFLGKLKIGVKITQTSEEEK